MDELVDNHNPYPPERQTERTAWDRGYGYAQAETKRNVRRALSDEGTRAGLADLLKIWMPPDDRRAHEIADAVLAYLRGAVTNR